MALQDTALAKQEINDSEMRAHIAGGGGGGRGGRGAQVPPVFEVHPLLYIVF